MTSSPTTDSRIRSPCRRTPASARARAAKACARIPDFMSVEPRPQTRSRVDLPGEGRSALPVCGVARRNDVDVAVVDQRAPAARSLDHADRVLPPGLDGKEVDLGSETAVDSGHELGDLALASDDLVVDLARVLRVHALDPNGARERVDELRRKPIDCGDNGVAQVSVQRHLLSFLGRAPRRASRRARYRCTSSSCSGGIASSLRPRRRAR